MKEKWSDTLWNEEIRRCVVVNISEKVKEARLRWYGQVRGGRHCREGERSKAEMVWTRNNKK